MNVIEQHQGKNYIIYNADCVDVAAELPDDSIGFSVFSPPFASLYTRTGASSMRHSSTQTC